MTQCYVQSYIRHFAAILLDETLTAEQQDPQKWDKFIAKVCRTQHG